MRQFIEHYRNTLANWDDPSYRAAKLRIALEGAPQIDYRAKDNGGRRSESE